MKANRHVSSPSTLCIYRESHFPHLVTHYHHIFLSSSDMSYKFQAACSSPHLRRIDWIFLFSVLTEFQPALTSIDRVVFDCVFLGEFLFQQATYFGTEIKIFCGSWPPLTVEVDCALTKFDQNFQNCFGLIWTVFGDRVDWVWPSYIGREFLLVWQCWLSG